MVNSISIIGVDDSVNCEDLADLSLKYPFVEWCLNIGTPKQGYPSQEWLTRLAGLTDKLKVSVYLRERHQHDMLRGRLGLFLERPELSAARSLWFDLEGLYSRHELVNAIQLLHGKNVFAVVENAKTNEDCVFLQRKTDARIISKIKDQGCGFIGEESVFDGSLLRRCDYIALSGFLNDDGITFSLDKVEKFLDIAEDYLSRDSWVKSVIEAPSSRRYQKAV